MKLRVVLLGIAVLLSAVAGGSAQQRAVVTIAHINDIYEIGPVEGGKAGGMARLATIVQQLRRTNPPVVFTLGGDYMSPSAIGTAVVDGKPLAGRQMVDILNATGLQWATLGNHEFDLSQENFLARMSESKFNVVVSNVTDAQGQPFPHTVASAIVPVKAGGRTIRLGLVGLVVNSNQKPWVKFQPPIEAAKPLVAALKGKVDATVALTHLALATDIELATAIPDVDLIIGGHEHENWFIRRGDHYTPIVKADANVRSVAVVSMAFGANGTRPTISARLALSDEHVKMQPATDALVKKWTALAFDAFRKAGFEPDAPVVTLTEPLDGREATVRNRPGKLTQMIANAIQHEAKADVGVFNGGSVRIDDVIPAGRITEYDVLRVLPFGGKVVRASFDGSLLAKVLDQGLGNQGTGGYLHSSDGMMRTSSGWTLDGTPLDPNKRYVVGISDFLLTGGETNLGYLTRTNAGVHDAEDLRDVRRVLIEELKRVYRN